MEFNVQIHQVCLLEVDVNSSDPETAEQMALALVQKFNPTDWLEMNIKNFSCHHYVISTGQKYIKRTRQKISKVLLRWIFRFDGKFSAKNRDDAKMLAFDTLSLQEKSLEEWLRNSLSPWFVMLGEPTITII